MQTAHYAGVPLVEILGGTAYGDGDTRVAVEQVGAKVTAKTQPLATTGHFVKTDFVIDPGAPSATCPAGQTTTHFGWTTDDKGRRVMVLKFGARCEGCSLRDACTTSRQGRSITVDFHESRLQAARADNSEHRSARSCDDACSSSASSPS